MQVQFNSSKRVRRVIGRSSPITGPFTCNFMNHVHSQSFLKLKKVKKVQEENFIQTESPGHRSVPSILEYNFLILLQSGHVSETTLQEHVAS